MDDQLSQPKIREYLHDALGRLFAPIDQNGFWDGKRIIARLEHDRAWHWRPGTSLSDRYGVFALSTMLIAKKFFGLDTTLHDEKIKTYLKYISENAEKFSRSEITYGAFNSLVLGKMIYGMSNDDSIGYFLNMILDTPVSAHDNQDSLCLIGLSLLTDSSLKDEKIKDYVSEYVRWLLSCQDKNGFFRTNDLRFLYHQRTMYVLWGLAIAAHIGHREEISRAIQHTLEHIWNKRREPADDAFLWHPKFYWTGRFIPIPMLVPASAEYLFECHQTFFANAVALYQLNFNTSLFQTEKESALAWIFGSNRIKQNLCELTGIKIPARIMTRSGTIFVPKEQFKGSYEIGSYIMALSSFLKP